MGDINPTAAIASAPSPATQIPSVKLFINKNRLVKKIGTDRLFIALFRMIDN